MGKAENDIVSDPFLGLPIRQTTAANIKTGLEKPIISFNNPDNPVVADYFGFEQDSLELRYLKEKNPAVAFCFQQYISQTDPVARDYLLRLPTLEKAFQDNDDENWLLRNCLNESLYRYVSPEISQLLHEIGPDINDLITQVEAYSTTYSTKLEGWLENSFLGEHISSFERGPRREMELEALANGLSSLNEDYCCNDMIKNCSCGYCQNGYDSTTLAARTAYGLEMFKRWIQAGGKTEFFTDYQKVQDNKTVIGKLYSSLDYSIQRSYTRMLLACACRYQKDGEQIPRDMIIDYYEKVNYDYVEAEKVFEKELKKHLQEIS
jgi:hypothetical protein